MHGRLNTIYHVTYRRLHQALKMTSFNSQNVLLNVFQVLACKLLILRSKFNGSRMTHTPPVIMACVHNTASLGHTVQFNVLPITYVGTTA